MRVCSAAEPDISVEYSFEGVEVVSYSSYVNHDGDRVDACLDVHFGERYGSTEFKLANLSLDEAEQFARKILDNVMDARMGRFSIDMDQD